jgi:hypothetical protein
LARSLSPKAVSSSQAQDTDEVWLVLLRIIHASITPGGVLRCVNNMEDITGGSDNQTYTAYPFQLDLPNFDVDQPSVAKLKIDNVDRGIIEAIRGLPTPPKCDIEVVLASQPTTIEISLVGMTLRAADYDALEVTGTMTYEEIFTEPVSLDMTPSRFPGMF